MPLPVFAFSGFFLLDKIERMYYNRTIKRTHVRLSKGGIFTERVILHSDANSFYASVECARNPAIRDKPVAVCGDPEARHGIVLTKNEHAKKFGIKTGEAIWQAKSKCPQLVVVPPDYDKYVEVSRGMRRIYEEYTDCVEAFGLDENWVRP